MRRTLLFALMFAASASGPDALAAAQRSFVSVAGNDANTATNCGITTPCRSFGSALTVTASGGEIVVLDSGGYGRVTIDRSASIVAPPGVYAGISVFAGTNGVDIATPGIKVMLRGLAINGQGGDKGINISNAGDVVVEGCAVAGMGSDGIAASAGRLFVHDSAIRGNGGAGLAIDTEAHLDRLRVEANAGAGIVASSAAHVVLRDSVVADNGLSGVFVPAGSLTRVDIESTAISSNGTFGVMVNAGTAGTKAEVTIARSMIVRNAANTSFDAGVVAAGNAHLSISDSTVTGNYANGMITLGSPATIIATGNIVTKNALYGFGNLSATFKTRSNNVVEDNFLGAFSGSPALTPVGGL
jgi:hypothetical protein